MKAHIQRQSWLWYLLPPALLSLITAIVYYPSLHYEFQFDDIANITKHFDIRHNSFKTLFFSGTRWISYWLNAIHYSVGKFDPYSYRIGNVAIHTINGLLIFFILFQALSALKKESFFKTNAFFIACLTALLFLIHPVQTQTVSYIIQGELEGMATMAILGMVLCAFKMGTSQNPATQKLFGIALFIIAALSTGTKEIAIISPALLILCDWFFIAQGSVASFKKRLWIYGALAVMVIGLYLWLLHFSFFTKILIEKKNNIGNMLTASPDEMITWDGFLRSQFKVILHYLAMFIWPFNISVEYDWVLSRSFIAPDCIFPFLILVAMAGAVARQLLKDNASLIGFGALWFALCMAPRSSIIPSPELLSDYKTYMASMGWLFLIACVLIYGIQKMLQSIKALHHTLKPEMIPVAACCILALPLGVATFKRNTIWRSGLEFWQNIIQNAPYKARAYNNYGVELSQRLHKFEEAVPYFQKAIAMDSKYPDPCNNLAVAYSQLNKIDEAIAALRRSIQINPYYPEGYNNLASFFMSKKDYEQAEKSLELAIKLRPYYGKAYFNMGRLYLEKGEHEKAWEFFKHSCTKADLDTDMGFATFAKVSIGLKKYEEGIAAYHKTLELNPQYPEAKFNLANAYFMTEKYENAIALYKEIEQENPQEYRAIYNLGEAYSKLRRVKEALLAFQKVEHCKDQMPYIYVRLAACYDSLGNPRQAEKELLALVNNQKAPEQVRQMGNQLLNQMHKHYGATIKA